MSSLSPLMDPGQASQAPDPQAAPSSFRERKLQTLQSESDPTPGTPEDVGAESAAPEAGYDEHPEDNYEEPQGESDYQDDEDAAEGDEPESLGALEEEPTEEDLLEDDSEEEPEEGSAEYWKARFDGMQRSLSKATENRKKLEQDFSDGIAENIQYRHSLEDFNQAAQERAEFFVNLANQQVQQFEQMDWNQIPPEEIANYRNQHQNAVQYRDAMIRTMQAAQDKANEDREAVKKREAEISRNVLARRIPNWGNEHLATLRDHALSNGFNADEFADITDHRIIMLLHKDWESSQAPKKVQQIQNKRKARRPRNQNARQQPRNAQGRYQSAKAQAHANPGDKSSFREMQMRKLQRERETGRR